MNKKILLTLLIVLSVVLSIGTIYASDVNNTDSYISNSDEPVIEANTENMGDSSAASVYDSNVDSDSENDVLESGNSNTLSTNTDESNVGNDKNTTPTIEPSKTITSKDVTKYYKGSAKYTATFYDNNGTALADTNVKIKVNGQTYTKKTDKNGVASLDINLKPGTYKVETTNPVTGYTLTNTFKILSTITANNLNKVVGDNKKFSAKFYGSNGKVLVNMKIKFKVNGKTYTVKTNKKGYAYLSLRGLKVGTFKIISYNKDGLTKTNTIKVVKSASTSLTADDYTFLKSDSKTIKVKLLDKYGFTPTKGKIIKIKINGKTYSAKTNSKSIASLKLPKLGAGVYTVKYSFAKTANYKASSTNSKVTIIPTKNPTFTVKSTTTFGHGAGTPFKVALTSGKVPLSGKTVTLTLNGQKYTKTTNKDGIVSLPIKLDIGNYTISYKNNAESKIKSKSGSTMITVKERTPSTIQWKSGTSFYQGTQSLKLLVLNSNNKPISGESVKLTANSKTYTATTSSSGYATFKVNLQTVGNNSISYNYDGDNDNAPDSGNTVVNILKVNKISIKNILSASETLKNYYANNNKLPSTVSAGGVEFTVPEFLYLMSQAISQLGDSNKNDIPIISGVKAPSSPKGDNIASKQLTKAKYITVAKNVASYITKNKQAPNFASSAVGDIIYSEIVDSFSRILAFYKNNNEYMPNYVVINYGSGSGSSSQTGTGLNEKNTVKDLASLLKSSKNCQVDNAAIKKIVNSITSGLTSDSAKATAIFNYVRDTISYSFYYDTKHGAVGTLNAKSGNCVDHSHLLVAMFRTADLPARYVHGTCTFSSGSTYGHVWTQVLIDGKWTVADATSSRNSLGNIANWNTKSFSLKGIYREILF